MTVMIMDLSVWPARNSQQVMTCCSHSWYCYYLLDISRCFSPKGGLLVDDAIDFAKTYSASNPNAALMVLLPVHYGTLESKSVIKNRRLLEDKLFAPLVLSYPGQAILIPSGLVAAPRCMEVHEFSMTFQDAAHAGDKRKRAQPCSFSDFVMV